MNNQAEVAPTPLVIHLFLWRQTTYVSVRQIYQVKIPPAITIAAKLRKPVADEGLPPAKANGKLGQC